MKQAHVESELIGLSDTLERTGAVCMIRVLPYPPPAACEQCNLACEPFPTRAGWLCWPCLPAEDRTDARGSPIPEPVLDAGDRADLKAIRERLGPEAVRCHRCGERRGPAEVRAVDHHWVCDDCAGRAAA